ALQKMMDQIASLSASDYTDSTWNALQAVLPNVNEVLGNVNAMQEEVDEVYTELVKAFVNLRLKPNKDLLQDLINKANGLTKANFTASSWALFEDELNNANKVLSNGEATEEQVTNAVNGLTKAMAGLVANPGNPAVDNNTNNPGNTVKPGDITVNATKTGDTTNMMYPLVGLAIASLIIYGNKKRRKI
ncbi:LPXTG cell wall anchor domain-containing protein, partial [Thomasclavelia sp.]